MSKKEQELAFHNKMYGMIQFVCQTIKKLYIVDSYRGIRIQCANRGGIESRPRFFIFKISSGSILESGSCLIQAEHCQKHGDHFEGGRTSVADGKYVRFFSSPFPE